MRDTDAGVSLPRLNPLHNCHRRSCLLPECNSHLSISPLSVDDNRTSGGFSDKASANFCQSVIIYPPGRLHFSMAFQHAGHSADVHRHTLGEVTALYRSAEHAPAHLFLHPRLTAACTPHHMVPKRAG